MDAGTPGDEALMRDYVRGDRRAFEQLFARWAPRIHGFFVRSLRDRATADELLQMTFLKIHQARESYREGAPLRPWLWAIAANVRTDYLRQKRRRAGETLDEDALAHADEARAVELDADRRAREDRADQLARVQRALDALPESQRVVLLLHRYEGLTFGEIAQAVGSTEGAVRVRAFRAYEALRKSLGAAPAGGDEAAGAARGPAATEDGR